MRHAKPKPHICHLPMPANNVRFHMVVTIGSDYIDVSPVLSEGVETGQLTQEAIECITDWAEEEAIRVGGLVD